MHEYIYFIVFVLFRKVQAKTHGFLKTQKFSVFVVILSDGQNRNEQLSEQSPHAGLICFERKSCKVTAMHVTVSNATVF
jgi:hypothetical protein